MRGYIKNNICLIAIICLSLTSCEDYLEVEAPDHKIASETVFAEDETAIGAMNGIYHQLFRAAFAGGGRETSIHVLAGLSSDELKAIRATDLELKEFEQNEIHPDNSSNLDIWSSAYNIIYLTNSLLEGIGSGKLNDNIRKTLEGEAKFVRAFTYFYLVNLYGEVPLILTTQYSTNAVAPRDNKDEIYQQIIIDLTESMDLLGEEYRNGDRTRVNQSAAIALLARVNLYLGNWAEAERLSSQVISNNSTYEILEDLNQVFLANSKEAIWQISPIGGSGGVFTYTNEGATFIFHPSYSSLTKVALKMDLVDSFDEQDRRFLNWIGYHEGTDNYFAYKYKDRSSMNNITEYSMVFRLAEQYLIRSEARAMQDNLSGAIEDLDIIRKRAGLSPVSDLSQNIERDNLLELIWIARRKELFTEWGHRWLDLKRTGRAGEVLGTNNPFWENTDMLYPIPAEERMKNPNLTQNPGY